MFENVINIDHGLNTYIWGSRDETCYGCHRMQLLSFQDDIARKATTIRSTQAGHIKICSLMKEKLLEVHPDKTGFIVLGSKQFKDQVRVELESTVIMFGDIKTSMKESDK